MHSGSPVSLVSPMTLPQLVGRCEYKVVEIVTIAICAVMSGAEGWEDIEEFGQRIIGTVPHKRPVHGTVPELSLRGQRANSVDTDSVSAGIIILNCDHPIVLGRGSDRTRRGLLEHCMVIDRAFKNY